jgi:hypothetical protein
MRFISEPRVYKKWNEIGNQEALVLLKLNSFNVDKEEAMEKLYTLYQYFKNAPKEATGKFSSYSGYVSDEEYEYVDHVVRAFEHFLAKALGWKCGLVVKREYDNTYDFHAVVSPQNEYVIYPADTTHLSYRRKKDLMVDMYEKVKSGQLPPSEPDKFLDLVEFFYRKKEKVIIFNPLEKEESKEWMENAKIGAENLGLELPESGLPAPEDIEEIIRRIEADVSYHKADFQDLYEDPYLKPISALFGKCMEAGTGYELALTWTETDEGIEGMPVLHSPDKRYWVSPYALIYRELAFRRNRKHCLLLKFYQCIKERQLPPPSMDGEPEEIKREFLFPLKKHVRKEGTEGVKKASGEKKISPHGKTQTNGPHFIVTPRVYKYMKQLSGLYAMAIMGMRRLELKKEECEKRIYEIGRYFEPPLMESDWGVHCYRMGVLRAYGELIEGATGWKLGDVAISEKDVTLDRHALVSRRNEYALYFPCLMKWIREKNAQPLIEIYELIKEKRLPESEPNKYLDLYEVIAKEKGWGEGPPEHWESEMFARAQWENYIARILDGYAGVRFVWGMPLESGIEKIIKEMEKNIEVYRKEKDKNLREVYMDSVKVLFGQCLRAGAKYELEFKRVEENGKMNFVSVLNSPDGRYWLNPLEIVRREFGARKKKPELLSLYLRIKAGELPEAGENFPVEIK